jgi:hypothetical protein
MNSPYGRQTLERIYYRHRLDTCVDIIYSIYPGNIKEGIDGKQVIEINDVLNKRNLWRRGYPAIGTDTALESTAGFPEIFVWSRIVSRPKKKAGNRARNYLS